jgi:hypothetical protein
MNQTRDWASYFDALDDAMHDFEVALSRRDVEDLRMIPLPDGTPPEELRERWSNSYQRILELEFRARALREELKAEFARLNGVRHPRASSYGSGLDISG